MAEKPLRPCRHPGCPELTRSGYCDKHKPQHRRTPRGESAQWHGFYSTAIWLEELRPGQLLREPFCRECAKRGLRVRATVVDHVEPHRGQWARFIDPDNLQSLCERCHNRKTMLERANRAKTR